MGALHEWVRSLVTLVLVAGVLELLVPKGNFKGYVRMTMGLVLVLGVVQPALKLLRHPVDLPALEQRYLSDVEATSGRALQERIATYQAAQAAEVRRLFAQKVTESVVQASRQVPGVRDARAQVELGQTASPQQQPPITRVTVWISGGQLPAVAPIHVPVGQAPSPTNSVAQSVIRTLTQQFGWSASMIQVLQENGSPPTGAEGGDDHVQSPR